MIEPDLPQIPINYDSITRVVMNLLTNAIKYSPNGKKVKVKVEKVKEYLEISVEDEGIGISEENQKKVFDRFFRVENKTHTVKGTGLGLHLVKVAVEKHHHGKVFVKSKLNEGSTFGIMLPIKVEAEELVVRQIFWSRRLFRSHELLSNDSLGDILVWPFPIGHIIVLSEPFS